MLDVWGEAPLLQAACLEDIHVEAHGRTPSKGHSQHNTRADPQLASPWSCSQHTAALTREDNLAPLQIQEKAVSLNRQDVPSQEASQRTALPQQNWPHHHKASPTTTIPRCEHPEPLSST